LLCDHLFIVPELDPVEARLPEEKVAKAKRNADDFKRVAGGTLSDIFPALVPSRAWQ
jgi:hypothetical protein